MIEENGGELEEEWWVFNVNLPDGRWGVEIKGSKVIGDKGIEESFLAMLRQTETYLTLTDMGLMEESTGSANFTMSQEMGGYAMRDLEWFNAEDIEREMGNTQFKVGLVEGEKTRVYRLSHGLFEKNFEVMTVWVMAKVLMEHGEECNLDKGETKKHGKTVGKESKNETMGGTRHTAEGHGMVEVFGLWAGKQVKTDRRWGSVVINTKNGKRYKWNAESENVRIVVEETEKEELWVALMGKYMIVAAEIESDEGDALNRMREMLENENDEILNLGEEI
jgi:hypothetical protein